MKTLTISVPSGTYTKTMFVEILSEEKNIEIFYSTDGSFPQKKYFGPFAVRKSSKIKTVTKKNDSFSEIEISDIKIIKSSKPKHGTVAIIGGAEHCKEIHEKLVENVGGKENVRIAFLPTSSSAPYSSGMDRLVRFRELAGVEIDESKIPELKGKKDFSNLNNQSRFWIVPVAIIDDENTGERVYDDNTNPLANESSFPDIDESEWKQNAKNLNIAKKLLEEDYNLVFMTGGNQARYLKCLYYEDYTETPLLSAIREILEEK
ncbi:MAG: chitobiase/beta-hexosaminidase C-terminal domain-containing protein, partial [Bacteroidales bacterium]|nr:chitobiase/beta-hexosaminidase C-terminal domain-containing protein [Bacteroidales bacterium]